MRKVCLDNIRWITVVLVVIYHVIYILNGVTQRGIIGPLSRHQPQDTYQYIVYPWFMLLLFVVSDYHNTTSVNFKGFYPLNPY